MSKKRVSSREQAQQYGWHTIEDRALVYEGVSRLLEHMKGAIMDSDDANAITTPIVRRVIGDTPEHGKHYIMDSDTECITNCDGGLAFSLGVACIEAEIARNVHRYWSVMHPNGVEIYHVAYVASGQIVVSRVGK